MSGAFINVSTSSSDITLGREWPNLGLSIFEVGFSFKLYLLLSWLYKALKLDNYLAVDLLLYPFFNL